MFLADGSVTSGDKDAVLLVGPKTPATKTFLDDSLAISFAKTEPW